MEQFSYLLTSFALVCITLLLLLLLTRFILWQSGWIKRWQVAIYFRVEAGWFLAFDVEPAATFWFLRSAQQRVDVWFRRLRACNYDPKNFRVLVFEDHAPAYWCSDSTAQPVSGAVDPILVGAT